MKKAKTMGALVPRLLLWAFISILVWGWIFQFLTDTRSENKITLFVDASVPRASQLAAALEEKQAQGIRMVKVHPFSYAMMSGAQLEQADLYIVPASAMAQYQDLFCPLPEEMLMAGQVLEADGVPLALRVYDHAAHEGAADAYIAYDDPAKAPEDYYLLFGRRSVHVQTNQAATDHLAVDYALHLLNSL